MLTLLCVLLKLRNFLSLLRGFFKVFDEIVRKLAVATFWSVRYRSRLWCKTVLFAFIFMNNSQPQLSCAVRRSWPYPFFTFLMHIHISWWQWWQSPFRGETSGTQLAVSLLLLLVGLFVVLLKCDCSTYRAVLPNTIVNLHLCNVKTTCVI